MLKYLCLQMISMLQSMQGDGGLQRRSITIIAKRFNMVCSTESQLWEWVVCIHAMGDIISPEINTYQKILGALLYIQKSSSRRVSRMSCCGRGIPKENL